MTLPTTLFEYSVANPFDPPSWTDCSDRLRSAKVTRGRRGELDTFREGTASFVVDNRDRVFEPGYSTPPFSGALRPNNRVRLSGDGVVVFDGFVNSIRPHYVASAPNEAYVEITATDLTKFMARAPLESPLAHEIRADGPTHWWRCSDPMHSGVMSDSGTAGETPTPGVWGEEVRLGAQAIVPGASTSSAQITVAEYDYANGHNPMEIRSTYIPLGTWTIECVFESTTPATITLMQWAGDPLAGNPTVVIGQYPDTPTGLNREVSVLVSANDASYTYLGPVRIAAPLAHVALTSFGATHKLYVNGVLADTQTTTAMCGPLTRCKGGFSNLDPGVEYAVAEIAVYDQALSAARLEAHGLAATAPWANDSTGSRIDRVLDYTAIPAGFRDIDGGDTTALAAVVEALDGDKVVNHARLAELTEQGRLFVSKDGLVTFQSRHSTINVTPVATFGDGAGEVPYSGIVEDFSDDTILNKVTMTRQGGAPQAAENAADIAFQGPQGLDRSSLLYGTDVEAFDAATYLLDLYVDPRLRIESLALAAHRSTTVATQCMTREIGDVVTVKRRPPGGGSAQEHVVVIEGVDHQVDVSNALWSTTFSLSPADVRTFWVLEDATKGVLGSTTRLAF